MPESSHGLTRLRVVPDLTIEVGDARGSTVARVRGGGSGDVVVDVDDVATLVRCLPGRAVVGDLPRRLPAGLDLIVPVRLTSQGRDLARIRLDERGRARYRATPRGVVLAGRVGLASVRPVVRTVLAGLAGTGAVIAIGWVVRRAAR